MKFIKFFIFLFCCHSFLFAQTPELITDFNVGEESGFNQFNFKGVEFENRLIFPIVSSEFGEELGVLQNGELSILKDLNEGLESSEPKNFTVYNDKVYFSAVDEINGGCLWSTDGTEENTQIVFSFDSNYDFVIPRGLIVSESGWLYYTFEGELYRTDGIINENLFSGVNFRTASRQASNNYTKYNNEVAFVVDKDNMVKLYGIQGDTATLLSSITEEIPSSFPEFFGLSEVSEGLIFGVRDPFNSNLSGTYSYNAQSSIITKITIAAGAAVRLHKFTDETSLSLIGYEGYYLTNGIQGEEQFLFASSDAPYSQGEGIPHGVNNDKMVFHASQGFFGDSFMYFTDGTSAGTSELFEVKSYLSNIFVYNNYAFLADGTSNNFKPDFYYINLNDGSFNNFYSSELSSVDTRSVFFLGVQNNKIYYISNLDTSIGRELYSIDIDLPVNTQNLVQPKFSVEYTSTSYKVAFEDFVNLKVRTYSVDGKLLESDNIMTNTDYELPSYPGVFFMSFELDGATKMEKVIRMN